MSSYPETNHFVRFVARPAGRPTRETLALASEKLRPLREGEFLLRNRFLSMDPAMVGRMRAESNYAESATPGEVMHCYGVGQVTASKNPAVRVGEVRFGRVDMQECAILHDADETTKLNLGLAEPTWYLGAVGVTGATAYFALYEIGKPRAGETVLISAGGSSVGTVAAQLARRRGCRVVGIVSTDDKAARVKREWGYDAVVSYRDKSIADLSADLAAACPSGVDVYFDNTSGDISEAVLDLYNEHARIAVVGRLAISHLGDTRSDVGRRDENVLLTRRVTKRGFVLLDYKSRLPGAMLQLAKWVRTGQVRIAEDVLEGIEQVPEAFFRMLEGKNEGKQLVRLGEIDARLDPTPRWLGRALVSDAFPTQTLGRVVARTWS